MNVQRNPFGADYDFELDFGQFGVNLPKWSDIPSPMPPPTKIEITVAIPNFNRAPLLESLIRSIMPQAFATKYYYEILIVDDASDDDSIPVLRELCKKYSEYNIKVIPLDNTRTYCPGHPWNVAAREAHGWIFMLFQPDLVMVDSNVLDSAWYHHHNMTNLFLAPFAIGVSGAEKEQLAEQAIREYRFSDLPQYCERPGGGSKETRERFGCPFPNPNGMSIRTSWLRACNGFDELIRTVPAEIDLFCRLTHRGVVYGLDRDVRVAERRYKRYRANPPTTREEYVMNHDKFVRNEGDGGGVITEHERNNIFMTQALRKMEGK